MPSGLKRYQQAGDLHFVTFRCYHRTAHLADSVAKETFEHSLEAMRRKYELAVVGYVVTPKHVHLLISEPSEGSLARALQALKISVSRKLTARLFWQRRYYDFNVYTSKKRVEKLDYMHRNPVTRGLVERPEDWPWSSQRYYASGLQGTVEIESEWAALVRSETETKEAE